MPRLPHPTHPAPRRRSTLHLAHRRRQACATSGEENPERTCTFSYDHTYRDHAPAGNRQRCAPLVLPIPSNFFLSHPITPYARPSSPPSAAPHRPARARAPCPKRRCLSKAARARRAAQRAGLEARPKSAPPPHPHRPRSQALAAPPARQPAVFRGSGGPALSPPAPLPPSRRVPFALRSLPGAARARVTGPRTARRCLDGGRPVRAGPLLAAGHVVAWRNAQFTPA